MLLSRLENILAGHHDAQVDDLVIIAPQNHSDDVLADVVDIALDGGHEHFALGSNFAAAGHRSGLLGLHEWGEVGD